MPCISGNKILIYRLQFHKFLKNVLWNFLIAIFLKLGSFSGNDVHWNIVGLYFGGCLCFDFEISTKVPTDIYRIDTIQRGKILLCFLLPVIPEVHQLTSCQTGNSLKTEKYLVTCFLGTSP